MDIVINGLTAKQQVFCDIMWGISSKEGVDRFIATLPKADQTSCHTLIMLMQLAFIDEVTDTTEAEELLSKFY